MARQAVIPTWVVPSAIELDDLHWLAYRMHLDGAGQWVAGVGYTITWVTHPGDVITSPVTGRPGRPVTEAMARAEMWSALEATPAGAGLPIRSIHTTCGLPHRPARTGLVEPYLMGVWRTLRWLLGSEGAQTPPLELPLRLADGTTPTAIELYAAAHASRATAYREPEQEQALLRRCQRDANCYARLAELIDETRRNRRAS